MAPCTPPLQLKRATGNPISDRPMENKTTSKPKKILAPPRRDDWPMITKFAYRCDYFRRWILAGVFGAAVLSLAGFHLTAMGVVVLLPLYGALAHLRCPACDTATTLKGLTDGYNCLSCGQRLRL
ncbi:MAG: hypothetical protein O2967_14720 [Proteobacteria bacterium]|nr:hypothetical protein [Pseudomonadota bacterium]